MASSLTALLDRLAYSPDDTLLFVGDLVSKSTLNSSLSTVSLLRQLGAQGVRGNHDQGVIEWRRWMEAYGPLAVPTPSASVTAGVKAHKGKQPWSSDVDEEEVERRSDKGVGRVPRKGVKAKRGWFGWGAAASEEQEEEEAAADAEEELEEELGYGDESAESSSDSSPRISSSSSTTTRRRPFGSQPIATESSASSRPSSAALSVAINVPTADSTGALLGPSWAWLDSSSRELRSLGVAVPKGWDWRGEWFEIARQLSSDDARYLEDLPLTLWIEELRTYVVHAGMREFIVVQSCASSY